MILKMINQKKIFPKFVILLVFQLDILGNYNNDEQP